MGGLASYTNLLGCLQLATEARKMFNGRNEIRVIGTVFAMQISRIVDGKLN